MTSHAQNTRRQSQDLKVVPRWGSNTGPPSTVFPWNVLSQDCQKPREARFILQRGWPSLASRTDFFRQPAWPRTSFLSNSPFALSDQNWKSQTSMTQIRKAPEPKSKIRPLIGRPEDVNSKKKTVLISRPLPPLLEVPGAATKTKVTCRAQGS